MQLRTVMIRLHPLGLLVVLVIGLLGGCAGPAEVHLQVNGATVHAHQLGQAAVWAWAPDFAVDLQWSGRRGDFVLHLHNVARKAAQVEVHTSHSATRYRLEDLSPTSFAIRFQGATGTARVELVTSFPAPLGVGLVGDNQGRDDVLERIIADMNETDIQFVVHLGDMVPSGQAEEYRRFLDTMAALEVPFYPVAGNHHVRREGRNYFEALFGPMQHSFGSGDYRFIFADSSDLGFDAARLTWLEEQLAPGTHSLLFMHVPPQDPRGGGHGFVNASAAEAVITLVNRHPPVATGHVHMFHHVQEDGIHWITSGGGGALLYASPQAGGFHHWVKLSLAGENLELAVRPVAPPALRLGLVVSGPAGDVEVSHEDLLHMAQREGESSFENQLGNVRGQGVYRGVPVAQLVALAGGMEDGDLLVVESMDGYRQSFVYANVYPTAAGWEDMQGEFLLAVARDEVYAPEWEEGYRVVFLPPGGVYTNAICAQTSAPGQGCHVYLSAGARWVRHVARLEVRHEP